MLIRMRKSIVAASVAVFGVLTLAGPAGAVETVYDPAAPQAGVLSILTNNWVLFAAMGIAIAIAAVPLLLAFAGIDGVWNTLKGVFNKARKGRR